MPSNDNLEVGNETLGNIRGIEEESTESEQGSIDGYKSHCTCGGTIRRGICTECERERGNPNVIFDLMEYE